MKGAKSKLLCVCWPCRYAMPIQGIGSGTFQTWKYGTDMNIDPAAYSPCSAGVAMKALAAVTVADGGQSCSAPPKLMPHMTACSIDTCDGEHKTPLRRCICLQTALARFRVPFHSSLLTQTVVTPLLNCHRHRCCRYHNFAD